MFICHFIPGEGAHQFSESFTCDTRFNQSSWTGKRTGGKFI